MESFDVWICSSLVSSLTFAGVGKTVIAAFDYKRFKKENPRARLLFVAHRKEILEQSIQTFQEILNDFNFGELYVDGRKPTDIEHLFISIQSFNSAKLAQWTTADYYDYICVDEFHHAAANSYQELLSYYHPKILLGLTATPDRMDGKDILKYFDGRTASKMLIGEAIDRNLLSTFQYFGITDEVDYRKLKWTRGRYDTSELEKIYTADLKRCSLVLESVKKYVADMDEVKGLGFCVSVAHADYMASTLPLYAEQDGESMSENKKTYMEESLWEVEHFLARENINRDQLNETLIDDMAYHYYKNYYYYEMDNEFALRAAVSVVLDENNITIDGFEMWIP